MKNKYIIILIIIFIIQSLNVAWCITDPNICNTTTYIALFSDGFMFGVLFTMLINYINKV